MKMIEILLVEDDPLDVINIKRNLDKLDIHYKMELARNGEEALTFLKNRSQDHKYPDIVLVDINMPRMNGIEFIEAVRKSEELKHLKCFIITTSDLHYDKHSAKMLGISGYIIKPVKLDNPKSLDSFNLMIDLMNF